MRDKRGAICLPAIIGNRRGDGLATRRCRKKLVDSGRNRVGIARDNPASGV